MKTLMIALLSSLIVVSVGCDKNGPAGEDPSAEQPADEAGGEEAGGEEAAGEEAAKADENAGEEPADEATAEKVTVAAAGQKFDPAIKPEQLPDGAWYCDMGTVHWAAMEKPEDGKCALCGMQLKEYQAAEHAAQKAKAVEAKDEHGHDHAEGEDGHEHGDDHDHAH